MNTQILPVHSRIGASSMHRWSICPGSVRLSQGIPSQSSKYAEEGTLAHDVASKILLGESLGGLAFTSEMLEAVHVYVVEVLEAKTAAPDNTLLVEHRFDLSAIHGGLYGTADAVVFNPSKSLLQVFDYKHGAGISVDVEHNEQLMYYGLGALLSSGFKAREVELIIAQPRCDHPAGKIRRWRFDSIELIDFAADLKTFAEATEKEDAKLVSGEHCRFCPAAPVKCPLLREISLTVAKTEFAPAFSYDPQKLAETLEKLPALEAYIKTVREFAYAEAEHGRPPPNWKLVEKRATRKWRDEEMILKIALENKLMGLVESKLKSVAQAEKTLGKEEFEDLFSQYVMKESSGLTLVHESDKRPQAKVGAASEFTKIETKNEDSDLFS